MTTYLAHGSPGPDPLEPAPAPYPQTAPPPELPYHRLALSSGRHRWWRPLAGTGVVVVGVALAALVVFAGGE
ncbi:hypothetical protein P8605_48740, partial [Streptomyces sp. T-3]|nr:hypothetical protein [Streptomyces sp. T-3]